MERRHDDEATNTVRHDPCWGLVLLGAIAIVAAVALVYPRDVERRVWYTLFAVAVIGALTIRAGIALLRRPRVPRASVPTPPAV